MTLTRHAVFVYVSKVSHECSVAWFGQVGTLELSGTLNSDIVMVTVIHLIQELFYSSLLLYHGTENKSASTS